ncbi:hypothetical protein O4157_16745 [Gordonia amicalis]|uniref:hypothetical protein n=1 Tax=Gordonia amicalis TaxID=89053 RepID=UPI0022B36AF1|nr:hypothetical protein [Gordonia amicalis]MCZ4653062.1 hypothetical protein [Gordonia amicalis]
MVSSPSENTIVYRINNLTDHVRGCEAFLSGSVSYTTPRQRIAPRTTAVLTVTDVPAGNYSTWWACDSFANGRSVVTVLGTSTGKPRFVENGSLSPSSALPMIDLGSLSSLFGA